MKLLSTLILAVVVALTFASVGAQKAEGGSTTKGSSPLDYFPFIGK